MKRSQGQHTKTLAQASSARYMTQQFLKTELDGGNKLAVFKGNNTESKISLPILRSLLDPSERTLLVKDRI